MPIVCMKEKPEKSRGNHQFLLCFYKFLFSMIATGGHILRRLYSDIASMVISHLLRIVLYPNLLCKVVLKEIFPERIPNLSNFYNHKLMQKPLQAHQDHIYPLSKELKFGCLALYSLLMHR